MKYFVLTLFLLVSSISIIAKDTIVMKNGDFVEGVVIEVLANEIKYKKATNPNGPIYSLPINSVLSIRYENGEVDKFESKDNTIQESNTQGLSKAAPSEDNEEIKAKYDVVPRLNMKTSNKKAKNFFPIMAFTDSSVISTKELTIVIDPTAVEFYDGGWKVKMGYSIQITNKTDHPIYIDRANSFRTFNDYTTQSYFNGQQTTVSHGNTQGGGIGIGIGGIGIGLGSSSSSTYSENHGVDRFLVLGPKSKANLVDYKYIRLSENKAKFKCISDIEYWGFNLRKDTYPLTEGQVLAFTEADTPYSNKYYITYSNDPEFKNAQTIDFELYAKYIVGAKIKQEKWAIPLPYGDIGQSDIAISRAKSRMVSEIKNVIPDFWSNSLVIIGTCGGNFY